jgi:uncharacterized protein YjbJ (UPF0337 family)
MWDAPFQPLRTFGAITHIGAKGRSHRSAKGVIPVNKDQVAGKIDQVAGKVKQGVGEAVGNENLANRGVADQVKGAAKETWGNVKDAANKGNEEEAHDTRENISRKVEDAKNRISDKIESIKEQHHMNDSSNRTA